MDTSCIAGFIRKMLERYDREYQEQRKHVSDPERLRYLDEVHHRCQCDYGNNAWEAFERNQRRDIARRMQRREFSTEEITEVTGLSAAEIEGLD